MPKKRGRPKKSPSVESTTQRSFKEKELEEIKPKPKSKEKPLKSVNKSNHEEVTVDLGEANEGLIAELT